MPKRTASNPGASISLFPFLAVLICTMGSLVTLLFAFAKHGQDQAVKSAAAKAAAESAISDTALQREDLQWRIEQLRSSRSKTQEQLSEKRLELSHVEDHLRRLRGQAERLRIEGEALEKAGLARSGQLDDARRELERLQRAIEAQEFDLQDQKPPEKQTVTYSVVPYEGPNQTHRRPIYIECRADAVVLQSEGIRFREADFEPPLGPGNPLAAAIRAYNEHLNGRGFNSDTTRPYPMLLVRPDGIVAYYAARAALESWGNEFGYELVGADWTLDFPPSDGTLTMALERVVHEARLRQSALAAAAPRQFLSRSRGAMRASPDGRGFVAEESGDGGGGGGPYGGQGFAARYNRNASRNATGTGTGTGPGPRTGPGTGPGTGTGTGPGTGTGTGTGRYASGGDGPLGSGSLSGDDRYAGTSGGSRATDGPSGSGADGDGPSLGTADGNTETRAAPHPDSLAGQPGGTGQNATGQMGQFGTPGQGYQPGSQASSGSAGASGMGGQAGAAGSAGSAGSGGAQEAQSGSPSLSAQIPARSKPPHSVASERGRDWGLPGASQSSTPISRPIIVRCDEHQLTIVPDDNRSLPKHIQLGYRTEDSVDALVSGVWDHMKGWGLAGRGMYWRPALVMEVAPNAVVRFSELQALLADSGLDVQMRTTSAQRPPHQAPQPRR